MKIFIPTILGLSLAAGTGIAQASPTLRAAPTAAVATPDNVEGSAANLGVIFCAGADVSFTVKGSNTRGTTAWYQFNVGDGAGNGCSTDITLYGDTGDTFSLYDTQATLVAKNVRNVSNVFLPPGSQILVDVSGGTKGRQFTLTITPT